MAGGRSFDAEFSKHRIAESRARRGFGEPAADREAEPQSAAMRVEQPRDDRATVLVIEDDPTLSSVLVHNLRRAGFEVLSARDGEEGLRVAIDAANRLDLILLDLMLPGMHGFHVLRQIRARSDVPVLILSARGEEHDKIDGLELGADDYVVKPFALAELLARVRASIRRRAAPAARPPAVLHRGALRIELDRQRAFAWEVELDLRPKEFSVLAALALEPERLFARQELLDAAWGRDIVVDPRTVDVHVSWLRGKLTQAGLPPDTIRTVYRAGYRFVSPGGDVAPAPVLG